MVCCLSCTLREIANHIEGFELTPEQKIGMYFRSLGFLTETISGAPDPKLNSEQNKTAIDSAHVKFCSAFVHAISLMEGYEDVTAVLMTPHADNVVITLTGQMTNIETADKLVGRTLEVDLEKANTAYFDAIADKRDPAVIFADQILKLYLPQEA